MKKLFCFLIALCLFGTGAALALPKDDLPSTKLSFEQLVGDNGDRLTRPGDYPPAGTYRIIVDMRNQIVTVYEAKTMKIVRQCLCSTGALETPTPVGSFEMENTRARFARFYGYPYYGQYLSQICNRIYFHSILYDSRDVNDINLESYTMLGKKSSHGCIRMAVPDARWIYFNVAPGSTVNIYDDLRPNPELRKKLALPKPLSEIPDLSLIEQTFAE